MLHQLIYMRSSYGRALRTGEKVRGEGFQVYSISEGLPELLREDEAAFVEKTVGVFQPPRLSDRDAPFSAFAYFLTPCGKQALGVFHTLVERRRGNFVAQFYLGRLDDYPCALIGEGEDWSAVRDTPGCIRDGYKLEEHAPPASLPTVMALQAGPLTRERIHAFIGDGRMDALIALLWAVLEQLKAAPAGRQPIGIVDYPEEVAKWAAAVQYALPPSLAAQVTFITNLYSPSANNAYKLDAGGHYLPVGDMRDASQVTHNRYLLVGIHPEDGSPDGFTGLRLNGARRRAEFTADTASHFLTLVRGAYGRDPQVLARFLAFYEGFPGAPLDALSAAFTFLENPKEARSYDEMLATATLLLERIDPGYPGGEIVSLLTDAYAGQRDADRRELRLLHTLWALADKCGEAAGMRRIEQLGAEQLLPGLIGRQANASARAGGMLEVLRPFPAPMRQAIQALLFEPPMLDTLCESMRASTASARHTARVLEAFAAYFLGRPGDLRQLGDNGTYNALVRAGFGSIAASGEEAAATLALRAFSENDGALLAVILTVADMLGETAAEDEAALWRRASATVVAEMGSARRIRSCCEVLAGQPGTQALVEEVLARRLSCGGDPMEVWQLFAELTGRMAAVEPPFGAALLPRLLEKLGGAGDIQGLADIASTAGNYPLRKELRDVVVTRLDGHVPLICRDEAQGRLLQAVARLHQAFRIAVPNTVRGSLIYQTLMVRTEHSDAVHRSIAALFSSACIYTCPPGFEKGEYYQTLTRHLAGHMSSAAGCVRYWRLFQPEDLLPQSWLAVVDVSVAEIAAYARKNPKRKQIIIALVALYAYRPGQSGGTRSEAEMGGALAGMKAENVRALQERVWQGLTDSMCRAYSKKLVASLWEEIPYGTKNGAIRQHLEMLLETVEKRHALESPGLSKAITRIIDRLRSGAQEPEDRDEDGEA